MSDRQSKKIPLRLLTSVLLSLLILLQCSLRSVIVQSSESLVAVQQSSVLTLQVSNPSWAVLWVLSDRSTVETCASNKSWIQVPAL